MSFQPFFPLWAIVLGFVLVLAGLSWLEIRRPGRWQRGRLGALVLALLAIVGLLVRPSREQLRKEAPIILLTQNFDEDTADSLVQQYPEWEIFRTPEASAYSGSKGLENLVALSGLSHRIGIMVGEGLPAYALEYLPEKHFQFFPSPRTAGPQLIAEKPYTQGQPNRLDGTFFVEKAPYHLLLKSPAGRMDSVVFAKAGIQDFSLTFTPPAAGRWQYELLEKDSTGRVLSEEILPLVVGPERQLRVLMLQAFPTFEVRYLKDFLADRGHAVAVRSQISRNNFRTEFANLASRDLSRLNVALLEDFDLLITDAAAFAQISRAELNDLTQAVENGLGFLGIVNGDNAAFRPWLGLTNIAADPDSVGLENGLVLPAYPVRQQADREWYQLQLTTNDRSIAAYYYRGLGKVGFQSAQESYAYWLRGDSLAYASFWMPVLEGSLREVYPDYTIELLADFPVFTGEPVDFRVAANQPVKVALVDSLLVPLREDPFLKDVRYGRFWPDTEGWHQISVGEESLDFYVFPEGHWPSLRTEQKRHRTSVAAHPEAMVSVNDQERVELEPVSRIWFYLLFLGSAGFLWLAPKL